MRNIFLMFIFVEPGCRTEPDDNNRRPEGLQYSHFAFTDVIQYHLSQYCHHIFNILRWRWT